MHLAYFPSPTQETALLIEANALRPLPNHYTKPPPAYIDKKAVLSQR